MFTREVIILLAFSIFGAQSAKFPKQFQKCRKSDPDLNNCLKNAIQNALPYMAKGMPQVGLVPIEPLHTKEVRMVQKYGPAVFDVTYTSFDIAGLSHAKIRKVRADMVNHKIAISANFPKTDSYGKYKIKANMLGLPIEGSGDHRIILDDVNATITLYGEKQTRANVDYLKVKDMTVKFENISKITFDYKNLFNGNQFLGRQANRFLNQFSDTIFQETKETTGFTMGKMFGEVAKGFYKRVPYNDIYL